MNLETLYTDYNDDLQKYACYLAGCGPGNPDVQDLMGDTWAKILRAGESDQYQGLNGASWVTWAKAILRNTWYRHLSNPRRQMQYTAEIEQVMHYGDMAIQPKTPYITDEILDVVTIGLTKKHLAVVFLKERGFSGDEMSTILGINRNLVYNRIHYAKKYLRRMSLHD